MSTWYVNPLNTAQLRSLFFNFTDTIIELSLHVHVAKKDKLNVYLIKSCKRNKHHELQFYNFLKLSSLGTWNDFTQQTSTSAKQIKPTCESNWWFREMQEQQHKQVFSTRLTTEHLLNCYSLTMLGSDFIRAKKNMKIVWFKKQGLTAWCFN